MIGKKDQLRLTPKQHQKSKTASHDNPPIFLQYKGKLNQNFTSQFKKLWDLQLVFLTQNLRSCIPTLKTSFDRDLKSHVVYEIKGIEGGFFYFGQTVRMLTLGYQSI